jgi:lipopolysaccharide export system permease protein
VLTVIDRYLIRQIVTTSLGITAIGLSILLLERLLRLFALVADPNKALSYVTQMLVMLMPHYLTIALPAALFFGILLTFQRLRRDSEFVVLSAAGQPLGRMVAPVIGLAVITTVIAAIILGYLGPHARYGYRSLKHGVAQASLTAAVLEGTFIHASGLTFFAEDSSAAAGGVDLRQVFVHQRRDDGGSAVVTGRDGWLGHPNPEDEIPVLVLRDGLRAEIPAPEISAGARATNSLSFADLSWPVITGEDSYRPRGRDQRELTAVELWQAEATATSRPNAAEVAAEFHSRLVKVVSVLVLPFLAVPLGLAGGPRERRFGVVIGLLILIIYNQAVDFGEAMAKRDLLSPLISIWLPFLAFGAGSVWLFRRSAAGRPLLPSLRLRRAGA